MDCSGLLEPRQSLVECEYTSDMFAMSYWNYKAEPWRMRKLPKNPTSFLRLVLVFFVHHGQYCRLNHGANSWGNSCQSIFLLTMTVRVPKSGSMNSNILDWRQVPLFTALSYGNNSVEADVRLVNRYEFHVVFLPILLYGLGVVDYIRLVMKSRAHKIAYIRVSLSLSLSLSLLYVQSPSHIM